MWHLSMQVKCYLWIKANIVEGFFLHLESKLQIMLNNVETQNKHMHFLFTVEPHLSGRCGSQSKLSG